VVWVKVELKDVEGDDDLLDADAVGARLPEKLWVGPVGESVQVRVRDRFVVLGETETLRDMV